MTENKTQAGKDGLRFDWYPILQADFLDDLASEVMATIEAARTMEVAFSSFFESDIEGMSLASCPEVS